MLSRVFLVTLVTVSVLMVIAGAIQEGFVRFMLSMLVVLVVLGGVHVSRGRGGGNVVLAIIIGFPVVLASILLVIPAPDVLTRVINGHLHVNVDVVASCVVVFIVLFLGLFITLAAMLVTRQDIVRERAIHKREFNEFVGKGSSSEMSRKKYYTLRLLVLVLCNVVVLSCICYFVEDPLTRYLAAVANAAVLVAITMYLKKRRGQDGIGGRKEAGKTIIMILLKGAMPFVMALLGLLVLDGRQLIVIVDGVHYMDLSVLAIQVTLWAFVYIAMFAFTFIMTTTD